VRGPSVVSQHVLNPSTGTASTLRGLRGTRVFDISAASRDIAYAATGRGLYETKNAGATWTQILGMPVLALTLDPSAPGTLYVAAGAEDLLVRTTNDGATWCGMGPLPFIDVLALLLDPRVPGTLYASGNVPSGYRGEVTDNALLKSMDGGVSWSRTGFLSTGNATADDYASGGESFYAMPMALDFATTSGVYAGFGFEDAGAQGDILITADGGATWHHGESEDIAIDDVDAVASQPRVAYAAIGDGGVERTTDEGASWTLTNGPGHCDTFNGCPVTLSVAVDPAAKGTVFAGTDSQGLFKTTNRGSSWTRLNVGMSSEVVILAVDPTGSSLFASSGNGLFALPLGRS